MTPYSIFIVDDEKELSNSLAFNLRNTYEVTTFGDAESTIAQLAQQQPDLILLDIGLPGMSGLQALKEIKRITPDVLVIMVTAYGDICNVVQAMKLGAHDYLNKPLHTDTLKNSINNALETIRLRKEIQSLQKKHIAENTPCFIGESNAIADIWQFITKVARSPDMPILIMGESGTGKELIASAIHYKSPNFKGPFTTINCAAIAPTIIESELFGYAKGAFSGAAPGGKQGLIEQAADGTLFLDEVGDLSTEAQAKLLRFLETGEFYRVGGTRKKTVHTRIVSATNQDLEALVNEKRFRLDLFYRLAVARVKLPSLNERHGDIMMLARYFLDRYSRKYGKTFTGFTARVKRWLVTHHWRGNVRELKNIIETAVIVGEHPKIRLKEIEPNLPQGLGRQLSKVIQTHNGYPPIPEGGFDLEAFEQHCLETALKIADGNYTQAAKFLRMSYYSFRYRYKKNQALKKNAVGGH